MAIAIPEGSWCVRSCGESLEIDKEKEVRQQKSHWNKIMHSDLIVLDELFYLKPTEENMALLYKTVMFLSETRSFIFVTNRSLSEWDKMSVDTHTATTFRQRIMVKKRNNRFGDTKIDELFQNRLTNYHYGDIISVILDGGIKKWIKLLLYITAQRRS